MARLRTFIAVELDKTIRDNARALQETLARTGTDVKWTEPENLHITLHFLGEVDARDVVQVCRIVGYHCQQLEPFILSLESAGCFPNVRRPRVLWVGVGQGGQGLCALHDALEAPLLELGCYRREARPYAPHLTLGRVKSDVPTDKLSAALAKYAGWQGGEMRVREVRVMSSELTPKGPVYTVLSRAKLGA